MSGSEPDDAPTATTKELSRFLSWSSRLTAAWATEADLATAAQASNYFVRAFENAPCDAAFMFKPETLSNLPSDPTDRLFILMNRYGTSDENILLPIDFKSFAYLAKAMVGSKKKDYHYSYASAELSFQHPQFDLCNAFVIGNLSEPDWVAFVPAHYVRMVVTEYEKRQKSTKWNLSKHNAALVQTSPLPPPLAPFTMPKAMLPLAIDNMVQNAQNDQTSL